MADVNAILTRLRDHIARIRIDAAYRHPDQLLAAELFDQLDAELSTGRSAYPLDWSFARRSMALNGCPIEPSWARSEPDDEPMTEV